MRRRGAVAGFSLLELLLAIAILGVIGGMVLVDHSGLLTQERLKSAARDIAGLAERARSQAITLRRSCLLQIDFARSRYRLVPDPGRDEFGRFVNPDTEVTMNQDDLAEWNASFDWDELNRDVYFVDVQVSAIEKFDERHGVVNIRFPPDGSVDPFIVHLKSAAGDTFSVSVNGLSGHAECLPGTTPFPVAEASDFKMGTVAPGTGEANEGKTPKPGDRMGEVNTPPAGGRSR
jgi:prepilin-type N-terminal cleavage/methylation domain-containing protein